MELCMFLDHGNSHILVLSLKYSERLRIRRLKSLIDSSIIISPRNEDGVLLQSPHTKEGFSNSISNPRYETQFIS
uniref:Uncharacterized protein n=1 Tax=Lepeophtheirus salmonis TaxID=72036 RepID=A0A0K2SZN3_LEPSM